MPLGFSVVTLMKYNLFLHFDFSTFLHNFSMILIRIIEIQNVFQLLSRTKRVYSNCADIQGYMIIFNLHHIVMVYIGSWKWEIKKKIINHNSHECRVAIIQWNGNTLLTTAQWILCSFLQLTFRHDRGEDDQDAGSETEIEREDTQKPRRDGELV